MVLVDPFMPQPQVQRKYPVGTHVGQSAQKDQPNPATVPMPSVVAQPKRAYQVPPKRVSRITRILQGVAITLLAIVLGFAASAQSTGEAAIIIYAVVAVILHSPSTASFTLALLGFVMIIVLDVLRPASGLAANFAIYAFLLMVVGTISLSLETRQAVTWKKWRRHSKGKHHV